MTIDHAGLAVLSGGLIGLMLGATGGGGSFLAIPLLVYVLGAKVQSATALSLVVVAASALIGVYQRRQSGEVRVKPGLVFSVTGAVGAWVGSFGHRFVRGETVLLLFGALMIVVAWRMWRSSGQSVGGFTGESCAERFPRSCWVKVSLIGMVVGLLTGFFGVGGGFVIVPALALVLGFPTRMAVSTSLLIIACVAVGGLVGHLQAGQMDWPLAGLLLLGSAVGMTGGSWVVRLVSPATLTKSVAVVAIGVAIVMIIHNGMKLLEGNM
ncbi:MAG: sulfite exporter TauE/SafE family protein [Nitrospira sp.]|nr:sulfite exporter TauE/SafE family protein [Nitrospira sp.]